MLSRISTAAALAGLMLACGSSSNTSTTTQPITTASTITIQNLTFSPSNLSVTPGTTVTVNNRDNGTLHSVTSQSAQGQYVAGSVGGVSFDTGLFLGVSTRTFTIPSSAAVGTVIPFFCQNHKQMMTNATQAQITVVAPGSTGGGTTTPPSGGGGTGGGGY
jgi:plastocyanin